MVVFSCYRSDLDWQWHKNSLKEYWKLDNQDISTASDLRYDLNYAGITIRKPYTRDGLLSANSRLERGMLVYNGFSPQMLKFFCKRRKIRVQRLSSKPKQELIAILERADDEGTFRLLDLPPELRVQIYEVYFSSFESLVAPTEPPISKTCRLVRQESLPVFYKTCVFELNLSRELNFSRELDYTTSTPNAALSRGNFFHRIPENHLGMIQNLMITNYGTAGVAVDRALLWKAGELTFMYDRSLQLDDVKYSGLLEEVAKNRGKKLTRTFIDTIVRLEIQAARMLWLRSG